MPPLWKLQDAVYNQVIVNYCKDFPNCENCEDRFVDDDGDKFDQGCPWGSRIDQEVSLIIYGADEEELYEFYGVKDPERIPPLVWKKGNKYSAICKCRPLHTVDDEITERQPIAKMSEYEPCTFRCTSIRKRGDCSYTQEKNLKESRRQRKLDPYMKTKCLTK